MNIPDETVEAAARAMFPDEFKWHQAKIDFEMAATGDEVEAKAFADDFHNLDNLRDKARRVLAIALATLPDGW
jgi:hypothetical protein